MDKRVRPNKETAQRVTPDPCNSYDPVGFSALNVGQFLPFWEIGVHLFGGIASPLPLQRTTDYLEHKSCQAAYTERGIGKQHYRPT